MKLASILFSAVAISMVPSASAQPSAPAVKTDSNTTRTAAKPLAPAVRKAYLASLREGQKLGRAKKWAAAIAAFEKALVNVPGDDRALSELSWAALSFGDFPKATKAGHAAALAATSAQVKGAALYNLGRVAEASGDNTSAAKWYRESLAVRANATVQKRLAGLPTTAQTADAATLLCAGPSMSPKALCECIAKQSDFAATTCNAEPAEGDFEVLSTKNSDDGEVQQLLTVGDANHRMVVADFGTVYNPGMMGISEEWSLDKTEHRIIGDRTVFTFTTTHSRTDNDMGVNEVEFSNETTLTFCVQDKLRNVVCPLQVVTQRDYGREKLMDDEDVDADTRKLQTKGLPIHTATTLSANLDAKGVVHIRAQKGKADPAELGDKPLW